MGRDFLKLKIDSKKIYPLILGAGFLTAVLMGLASWKESRLENRALVRNMTGEGSYEQELTARTGTYGKIPLTVTVEERRLSEREAEEELARAEELLPELLMGENESLRAVTHDLNFAEEVPGTLVEADWQTGALEYFTADGKLRKEVRVTEPVVIQISAVLSCQDKVRDFKTEITLIPREETAAERLGAMVADSSIKTMESAELPLPEQYEGEEISWRKPMDMTFLYLLLMIPAAAVFLKLGEKRDRDLEKQKIREELDGDYAGLVGKFTMLLAAGMSIRSAWERIVALYQEVPEKTAFYAGN